MLVIRKEQLEALSERGSKRYAARLADYLERKFRPLLEDKGLRTTEATLRFAEEATTRAQSWRFEVELDTTQLALILLSFGMDAREKHPFVDEALADRDLAPIGKVRKILSEARALGHSGVDAIDITAVTPAD